MLLTKEVEVRWNGKSRKYYEDLGYKYTKHNDIFTVHIEDLLKTSHIKIDVQCDYCGKCYKKEYRRYIKDNYNSIIPNDCCAECQPIKARESNLVNYGVENTTQLKEVRDKMKNTMLEKYGVEHNMQHKPTRLKAIKTFKDNYGYDNPMKHPKIIAKSNASKIKRFGCKNPLVDEKVLQKTISTNLKRYGTKWQMQSDEVMQKSKKTMYYNRTAPCSRQQEYIHKLLGGKLNYPVDRCSLDIAFPNDKIYIEYNGGGHDLSVKLGDINKKEFKHKEIRRYMFLKNKGWKLIKINSPNDYIPSDDILLKEFKKAKEWFKSDKKGHYHYNINIGKESIDDEYGILRKVTENDL